MSSVMTSLADGDKALIGIIPWVFKHLQSAHIVILPMMHLQICSRATELACMVISG